MHKKKYDLIVFDWDGTIIDSQAHILSCMKLAFASANHAVPEDKDIRHIIGLSLASAIKTLDQSLDDAEVSRIADLYRQHFFSESTQPSELFAGAADTILDLHAQGYFLAVATGKGRHGLDVALETTGLGQYFHITRCADETRSKPDPLMLDEILTDLDLLPEQAIMVGDTSYDVDMARNIKMDSIAVTYGMHDPDHLRSSNPTYFADSIDQVVQFV